MDAAREHVPERGEAGTRMSRPDPEAMPVEDIDTEQRGPRRTPRLPPPTTGVAEELDEPTWPNPEGRR